MATKYSWIGIITFVVFVFLFIFRKRTGLLRYFRSLKEGHSGFGGGHGGSHQGHGGSHPSHGGDRGWVYGRGYYNRGVYWSDNGGSSDNTSWWWFPNWYFWFYPYETREIVIVPPEYEYYHY